MAPFICLISGYCLIGGLRWFVCLSKDFVFVFVWILSEWFKEYCLLFVLVYLFVCSISRLFGFGQVS